MKIKMTFFSQNNSYPRGTTVVDEVNNYLQLHSNKDTNLDEIIFRFFLSYIFLLEIINKYCFFCYTGGWFGIKN
jgi:hypothetical protein